MSQYITKAIKRNVAEYNVVIIVNFIISQSAYFIIIGL